MNLKKAQDVLWKKKPTKKEGTIEVKPKQYVSFKNSAGISNINSTPYFRSGFLAKMIAETFKKMKKTCIPVAMLFHSCYSAKIEDDKKNKQLYDEATTAHENMRIYSSTSSKELSYDRIKRGNYSFPFLQANNHCLLEAAKGGKKTLEDQWACIIAETKRFAGNFGKKQTPTKYLSK